MDLQSKNIGFIGGGEMAYAIAVGMKAGGIKPSQISVSNPSAGKFKRFQTEGMNTTHNNMEIMDTCEIVLICIKPQIFPVLVEELKSHPKRCENQLIISIVGGLVSETLEKVFDWARVIRTVPNTPCKVQEGILLYCKSKTSTDEDMATVKSLFSACAECLVLPERLMDAGQAISGCGVAYIYTALDALADGGVKMGLPRATALTLAAKTCAGAGNMYLQTQQHPGVLKDAVTSPGGITICALHALDKGGFRAALIDAVEVATNKSLEIGAKK
uniref:Pyrroline-5-carboxylate reductase n=1 Tax=Phallusia mammillata TaxID=59560 RepID=A0A6F9DQR8_9ASCI|nr:pyrroline-5-carboxylate reductase 1, mitochondrial [Phallusia mammillata]